MYLLDSFPAKHGGVEVKKETRWNEETWLHDTKHEIWASDNDLYILEWELSLRIMSIKATRDKCGISPDDKESEPNKHIESLVRIAKQFGIE